ncbi:MAG: MBL fold metallo-hydrolase [Bacteroidales bacterium]
MKKNRNSIFMAFLVFSMMSLSGWSHALTGANLTGVQRITENVYLLSEYGCNILVMVGHDGLLVIDTGHMNSASKTDSAVHTISNLPVKFILNTHLHFDHVGGNMKLSEDGAVIVSHENTRKHMLAGWEVDDIQGVKYPTIPPYPIEALPVICFMDSIRIFFNNSAIQGIHYPYGHSDCDVIYYIQDVNIIHAGDLFESNGFPIIDVFYGGTIDGYIKAVDNIIEICDDKTIVISGHGAISNRQGLLDYKVMLAKSRERISKLIEDGKSLDEVVAANPTKGLYKGGKSWIPENLFVATVYMDLSKKL